MSPVGDTRLLQHLLDELGCCRAGSVQGMDSAITYEEFGLVDWAEEHTRSVVVGPTILLLQCAAANLLQTE